MRQSDLDAFIAAASEHRKPGADLDELRRDLVANLERARIAVTFLGVTWNSPKALVRYFSAGERITSRLWPAYVAALFALGPCPMRESRSHRDPHHRASGSHRVQH